MATISASVGEPAKSKNRAADVKVVQSLLNDSIALKLITAKPLTASGTCGPATIAAIREFQAKVVHLGSPDGVVSPSGPTFKLLRNPPDLAMPAKIAAVAITNMGLGPVSDIGQELWQMALKRMIAHSTHPDLRIANVITIVDFRRPRLSPRLWVVDLVTRDVLHRTFVAHGDGTKDVGFQHDVPTAFSNVKHTRLSCVGAFVTRHTWNSSLGHVSGKAMGTRGLESSNSNAEFRGIHFHGADYVKPGWVRNSWGCFATHPDQNESIVKKIRYGSFVYAYAGMKWAGASA